MKNAICNAILIVVLFSAVVLSFTWHGCKTVSPLGDALGSQLSVADYKAAGEAVGEAGYYAYAYLKQDAKYEKYTKRCEEIYAALEKAQGGDASQSIDVAAVNDAALQVLNVVLAAKYGPTQAALITAGARIGVGFAYNLVKKNIPESKLNLYLDGVWSGIQTAKANGADLIAEPTEIDRLLALEPSEECGIECVIDKVRARLNAGNLTEYDQKRLKKRLKELEKQYEQMKADIEKEFEEEGLK